MERYSLWFGIIFLLPFMTNYLTVGMSMLVVHKNELKKVNRVAFFQLTVFSIVGLVFINKIPEVSFLLGIVIAQVIALPIQVKIISIFYEVSVWKLVKPLVWVISSSVVPVMILVTIKDNIVDDLTGLILSGCIFILVQWFIIFSTYFDRKQRKQVFDLISLRA